MGRTSRVLLGVAAAVLLVTPGHVTAGGAGAPPPPRTASAPAQAPLTIPGLLPYKPGEPTDAQIGLAGMGLILARNAFTGDDSLEFDPWPCTEDGEQLLGFIPNEWAAYQRVRASLLTQGFVIEREVQLEKEEQVAFLVKRGSLRLGGLWGKAVAGERSTLLLCEWALK